MMPVAHLRRQYEDDLPEISHNSLPLQSVKLLVQVTKTSFKWWLCTYLDSKFDCAVTQG